MTLPPLQAYVRKHGRPFRVSIPNGKGTLTISVHDGYIELQSHQRGLHPSAQGHIYITAPAFRQALKRILPALRKQTSSFDAYTAQYNQSRLEAKFTKELRDQKRGRYRVP